MCVGCGVVVSIISKYIVIGFKVVFSSTKHSIDAASSGIATSSRLFAVII